MMYKVWPNTVTCPEYFVRLVLVELGQCNGGTYLAIVMGTAMIMHAVLPNLVLEYTLILLYLCYHWVGSSLLNVVASVLLLLLFYQPKFLMLVEFPMQCSLQSVIFALQPLKAHITVCLISIPVPSLERCW